MMIESGYGDRLSGGKIIHVRCLRIALHGFFEEPIGLWWFLPDSQGIL